MVYPLHVRRKEAQISGGRTRDRGCTGAPAKPAALSACDPLKRRVEKPALHANPNANPFWHANFRFGCSQLLIALDCHYVGLGRPEASGTAARGRHGARPRVLCVCGPPGRGHRVTASLSRAHSAPRERRLKERAAHARHTRHPAPAVPPAGGRLPNPRFPRARAPRYAHDVRQGNRRFTRHLLHGPPLPPSSPARCGPYGPWHVGGCERTPPQGTCPSPCPRCLEAPAAAAAQSSSSVTDAMSPPALSWSQYASASSKIHTPTTAIPFL